MSQQAGASSYWLDEFSPERAENSTYRLEPLATLPRAGWGDTVFIDVSEDGDGETAGSAFENRIVL